MIDLSNYVVLGFDFRCSGYSLRSVDVCVWDQATTVIEKIYRMGYRDNLVQLLNCPVSLIENNVDENTVAIAIAVSRTGLNIMEKILSKDMIDNPKSPEYLIKRGWTFEGFDIADGNGYFSIFGIDQENQKLTCGKHLFSSDTEAGYFIQPAERLYPEHSPFVCFAVLSYENKQY